MDCVVKIDVRRGWDVDNAGENIDYYLYDGRWYYVISPYYSRSNNHPQLICSGNDGGIGFRDVEDESGGVQKRFTLKMILVINIKKDCFLVNNLFYFF